MAEPFDTTTDLVTLLRAVVDIESVSGNEAELADRVEATLAAQPHLELVRHGHTIVARTNLGRPERVVIAGHLDTVPVANNLPSWVEDAPEGQLVYGRGTCDMKGGVAVALSLAAELTEPVHDVTWVCYDNEEVEAAKNGLNKVAAERPELLAADFAVLGEPTGARVEGGCQGTMRAVVTFTGTAAHSARAWMGHNAIHDAAELLNRLTAYEPEKPVVDGLEYHEGLNAVRITGGIAGNVIPDRCEIELNYRFAPDKDLAAAEAYLTDFLQGLDFRITDKAAGARPGLDLPVAQGFLAAVGGEPRAKYGWTDVSRFAALGVPAVNFGPADPIKAHTDDEYCPIDQLHRCREVLGGWLSGGAR